VISLKLFGRPFLEDDDGLLTGRAVQRHRLALLALLALAPGRSLSREKLVGYLWPERRTHRARNLLNVSVHMLRKTLGADALLSEGDDLRLNIDLVRVDVAEFEDALASGASERAVSRYIAPFLDGFYLDGSPEFERWVDGEQARLAGLYERALESLAKEVGTRGDHEAAVGWWRRLSAHNPYNGRVALGLMRSLETAGDRGGAIRHAQAHEALLREELGAKPDSQVAALAERLKKKPAGVPSVREAEPGEHTPAEVPMSQPGSLELSHGGHLEPSFEAESPPKGLSEAGRRWLFWTALATAVVVVALVGIGELRSSDAERLEKPARVDAALNPRRVLVLPLENETGDTELDALGRVIADWTIQGIARTGLVEVVSFPGTLELTEALIGSSALTLDPGQRVQWFARNAAAGTVVWGSLSQEAGHLTIQAQVSDVANNKLLAVIPPVTASRGSPLVGAELIRQRVMGFLAVRFGSALSGWAETAPLAPPPMYDAYLEYVAGLETWNWEEIYAHYSRAVAIDSTFAHALIGLLKAGMVLYSRLDRDSATVALDSVIALIERRRHLLSPTDRYQVRALEASFFQHDQLAAYDAERKAAALSPDRLNALLGVAFSIGHYRETVEILRRPDFPLMGRPYRWKILTASLHFLGEHEEELKQARQGKEERPGRLSLFEQEATALAALGRLDELDDAIEEGLRLGTGQSDMPSGVFLKVTGNELLWHGHEEAGREVLRRALPALRELASRSSNGGSDLFTLAEALFFLNEWDEVRELTEPRVTAATALERAQWWYPLLGMAAAKSGAPTAARKYEERLKELDESAEFSIGFGASRPRFARAQIAAALGECERATQLLGDALRKGHGHQYIHRRPGFIDCKDHPAFQEIAQPHG
jgi:DNA-binding SARP family transcriptional activator/TolB-like protein